MSNTFAPLPPPLTGQQVANQQRALDALHGVFHPPVKTPAPVKLSPTAPIQLAAEPTSHAIVVPTPTPIHKAHFNGGVLILVVVLAALFSAVSLLARELFKRLAGTTPCTHCSGQAHVHIADPDFGKEPWAR